MSMLDPEEPDRDEVVFDAFVEKMETQCRSLGLYMKDANGGRRPIEQFVLPGTDPLVRPFVAATFLLGDEAFSDRVQHPEKYTDDAILASIEHSTYKDEASRLVEEYKNKGVVLDGDE